MIKEDGHSAYAEVLLDSGRRTSVGRHMRQPSNETMAEVTRYLTNPQSWHEKKTPDPDSPWVVTTQLIHEWYKWHR